MLMPCIFWTYSLMLVARSPVVSPLTTSSLSPCCTGEWFIQIWLFTAIYFFRLITFLNYGPVLVVNVTKILTSKVMMIRDPKTAVIHFFELLYGVYIATTFNEMTVRHGHISPAKMSECTDAYFNTQERLTTWNDELEFLGYILCEILGKRELDARGFRCHQAAELPALIKVLRHQLKEPNGTLTTIMADHEHQIFRRLLKKAREIRNQMAHHQTLDDDKLNNLGDAKEQLCNILGNNIRRAASKFGTHQVCAQYRSLYSNT